MRFLIVLQCIMIAFVNMMLTSVIALSITSTTSVEFLNNVLAALILDQIDNMGSLILVNWLRSSYNELTT